LRKAFRKLEYEKSVVNFPRKETYVTKLSIADCKHLYFTRRIIKCAAIDAIAENKTQKFSHLRRAIKDETHTAFPKGDDVIGLMNYYEDISSFHWLLVEMGGNRWLNHCYCNIDGTLIRY
jgi:DNA-binding GntR family transcriptional regulator